MADNRLPAVLDGLNLALSVYKDRIRGENARRYREAIQECINAEAECKREKGKALILNMEKLRIALGKVKTEYEAIRAQVGRIDFLENDINYLETEIKRLSRQKNNINRLKGG